MPTNILKTAFTGIVGTLCIILIFLTGLVAFDKFNVETYKGILEVLGIPTLFGMIVQSFIHQKPEDVPHADQIIKSSSTTVVQSPADSTSGSDPIKP